LLANEVSGFAELKLCNLSAKSSMWCSEIIGALPRFWMNPMIKLPQGTEGSARWCHDRNKDIIVSKVLLGLSLDDLVIEIDFGDEVKVQACGEVSPHCELAGSGLTPT
jgi:hypothetical protein